MNNIFDNDVKLKISIITIVYNNCIFIEDAIKSVVEQSYKNIEYIVIDGGSTDGTVDIIKAYETYITEWISEEDNGIAEAFNKGLSLATGDYILFLNSDDMLVDYSVIQTMIHEISRNNYPCFVYGDFNIIDRDSGNRLYRGVVKFSPKGMIKKGEMLPHPCLFTNREYFKHYGLFDTRYKIAMDYEIFLRGIFAEKVVHVPVVTTKIRSGGISTKNRSLVVDEIIAALEKNGFLRSKLAVTGRRLYFVLRYTARKILEYVYLYKIFSYARNVLNRSSVT